MSTNYEHHVVNLGFPLLYFLHVVLSTPIYNSPGGVASRILILRCIKLFHDCFCSTLLNSHSAILLTVLLWNIPQLCKLFNWNSEATQPSPDIGGGPWLLPCRTSHSRQFPKRHAFSYSYLQLAFQVGQREVYGSTLCLDKAGQLERPWTWFSISEDDYLFRGKHQDGLRGKLQEYLKSERLSLSDFSKVFLVTAPRFLGYSFNPVSFWYLYDLNMRLKHMILEVNNTFDERRMYLLEADSTMKPDESDHESGVFRQTWSKDFHVSPFSSRKGSYSLVAQEPIWAEKNGPLVNNTITLRSSKNHSKLIARLFSVRPGVHIKSLSTSGTVHFILSWCWVGFLTFPRILKEAAKIYFSKGLHVWFRPEVLRGSIGRTETTREAKMSQLFPAFIANQAVAHGISLHYTDTLARQVYKDARADSHLVETSSQEDTKALRLHVNSPMFFSRYARDVNFVTKTASLPDQDRPYSIEGSPSPESIKILFTSLSKHCEAESNDGTGKWAILSFLRRCAHGKSRRVHPMDEFARAHDDGQCITEKGSSVTSEQARQYAQAVQGLLLSDLLTFGSPELLDALGWLVMLLLGWSSASVLLEASMSNSVPISSVLAVMWFLGFAYSCFRPLPSA